MIRPFTICCMALAAGSGLYTYQSKHQAELLDRNIAEVMKEADAARARSAVLRAEYALMNDPQRLAQLAAIHLPQLRPTDPKQYTSLADMDRVLPPVAAAPVPAPQAPVEEPEEPAPLLSAVPTKPVATNEAPAAILPVASRPALIAAETAPLATVAVASTPLAPPQARPAAAPAKPQAKLAMAQPAPSHSRARTQRMVASTTRAPRPDPFVTPVAAPSQALARLAQAATATSALGGGTVGGVGRSGVTYSSLGMARTGAAGMYGTAASTP